MKSSETTQPDSHLPLKPAVFLVLLALAEEEQHGYALASSVRQMSDGKLRLATGPLYRTSSDCSMTGSSRNPIAGPRPIRTIGAVVTTG